MSYIIGRHINGISLNPMEWVLNDDDSLMQFITKKDAMDFIQDNEIQGEFDDLIYEGGANE